MASTDSSKKSTSFFTSLTFRGFLVALLMLLMMIPLLMVGKIVNERNQYYSSVITDISKGWGDNQTIIGPILSVPYIVHLTSAETVTDSSGVSKTVTRDIFDQKTMIILPEELRIDAKLNESQRKRGLYESLVYKADVKLSGYFNLDALPRESKTYAIRWSKATLSIGLSDTKAITSTAPLRWGDNSAKFEPGTRLTKILPHGFHASMKNTRKGEKRPEFKIQLSFNGSTQFRFAPVGENTVVNIESGWQHPSFQGDVLPISKIISDEGFSAEWNIPHLSRNYPQSWLTGKEEYKLDELTTGVDLFTPVSLYSKVERAVKYGALFIGLTFLIFLVFEITVKSRMHLIQYAIIGLSLSLFYLLLVSLAEKVPFVMAYYYAAGTVIGIITLYTFAVLRSFAKGIYILILLSSLFAALFYILQMEKFALLAGAGVMLFVIVILMIASRNIQYDD